ncbi:LysM peptidoglycan-binding domain-containing protein [Paenibacillus flagellatus]|uniref:Peptidoglycan-binding protein LysM n=1 Tax=Paenibacillus flagellatus TaxID=2211139 RepID=A0A2V5KC23_9BACL|nr:LysM domain-containing protein [Paenibacillus flagellatus]PYI57018.1 peptidoglycan-binding protein LysM [Paenibacillus flagellatus]
MATRYENIHAIRLSFNNEAEGFRLPINPESIEVRQSVSGKTYDIVGGGINAIPKEDESIGEINVIKGPQLMEISFKSFFPVNNSLVIDGVNLKEPMWYVNKLRSWMHTKRPIRFIYVGYFAATSLAQQEREVHDINIPASIEKFEWREVAGSPGDIEYELALKEYRFYAARRYDVVQEDGKTILYTRPNERLDERVRPETYTLQPGDNLINVAMRFYNTDSSRYKDILALNGITDAEMKQLAPGRVIKLPAN